MHLKADFKIPKIASLKISLQKAEEKFKKTQEVPNLKDCKTDSVIAAVLYHPASVTRISGGPYFDAPNVIVTKSNSSGHKTSLVGFCHF